MAGHQNKSINMQGTESSCTAFHQNIRGMLKKIRRINKLLSPDFPQVLCLTEHHLKYFEIDFIYMDQYNVRMY
jgi:hypothetical protein